MAKPSSAVLSSAPGSGPRLLPTVADFIQLFKPRIVVLLAITCAAGYAVACKGNLSLFNPAEFWLTVVLLALSAGGANMVNMWYDADIDPHMARTRNRPIPAGRLHPLSALVLGIVLGVASVGALTVWVNPMAAAMAAAGYLFYVFVYTMLLKRRTVQNIVIGGAAGAFPPLVGWAAVQGDVSSPLPWLMFAIIFLWTPPHFWALALMSNADYTRAGVPMLPVVAGEPATRVAIVRYMVLLIAVTLTGGLMPPLGLLYVLAVAALGAWWLRSALKLLHAPTTTGQNKTPAKLVFTQSLSYLALLFAAMVVDAFL